MSRMILLSLLLVGCAGTPTIHVQPTREPTENGFYVYRFAVVSRNVPLVRKGVALLGSCESATSVGAQYAYTYWVKRPACEIEWFPMIWGSQQVGLETDPSEWLMEFNEPDQPGQADLTPEQAVPLIRKIEELYPGYKLVSPAVSQTGGQWLEQTRDLYHATYGEYPRWDAVSMHCYFGGDDESLRWCINLADYYARLAQDWNAQFWITEFAGVGDLSVSNESIFIDYANSVADRFFHFPSQWEESWDGSGGCEYCSIYALYRSGMLTPHGRMFKNK